MPSSAVIADVSATLRVALNNALSTLQPPATAEVHDLLGNIPTSPARLTLFLFEIVEDASQRNRPPVRGVAPPEIPMGDIFKSALPFLALQIVGLTLCMLFPQIITWLPRLVYG